MLQADLQATITSGNLRRAASALVVDYGSDVYAACVAMVRDRTAAEDLTQEIFGDAIRALSTFRGEAAPRTWLLSIARNRCIDYLRARKRDPWGGTLDDEAQDPDAHPDLAADAGDWFANRDQVARALEVLAEGDRALVVLRFKNGLDYDELAAAFGLRSGTVRMRVSRALARMREVLEAPVALERARSGAAPAPAPAPAFVPMARATVASAPPISWWQRLLGWARDPTPVTTTPVGALGQSLVRSEPSRPSEQLLARLGHLVDGLPG